jgi:lysophospholipase L1-like esterase
VIWRRTEALNFAPSQFFGLDFGSGTLLAPTVPAHKMEVIGDSITCGYGNEGNGPGCSFSYETENNYLAYGSVAARVVGADLHTECWSGKGVYRNRDGTTDTVPTLFDKAIPTEGSSSWDFAWKPDAVVVNLGTNDFAMGDPGAGFVTAYEDFVTTIRGHYPNAYVFVMIGPMTGEPDLGTTRGYLDQVVQARKNAGDDRIEQVQIDPQDGNKNGLGCDYHPSAKTHDIVGQALASAMKTALGW